MRRVRPVVIAAVAAALGCAGSAPPAAATTAARVAPTPPMGWSTWNHFQCAIDEQLVRSSADAMVAAGLRRSGYVYVNVDDCWMAPGRDAQGNLQADPARFPSGMRALADYVHARGLKLGIYASAGTLTCVTAALPGSLDHEAQDARTFAAWRVDLLKYDNCSAEGRNPLTRFGAMAGALRRTGRPIVYSIATWGFYRPWLWARRIGAHMWRTAGDLMDNWPALMTIVDLQSRYARYSGPNGWNDPDMLQVGNGGMTTVEDTTQFSLWALMNAPLIAGNDVRAMSPETRRILTNREVIAVDRDWAGVQGRKLRDYGQREVWGKPMSDGSAAVVLLNRLDRPAVVSATPAQMRLRRARSYVVRDLWAHATRHLARPVRAVVPAHGVAMYRIRPVGAT